MLQRLTHLLPAGKCPHCGLVPGCLSDFIFGILSSVLIAAATQGCFLLPRCSLCSLFPFVTAFSPSRSFWTLPPLSSRQTPYSSSLSANSTSSMCSMILPSTQELVSPLIGKLYCNCLLERLSSGLDCLRQRFCFVLLVFIFIFFTFLDFRNKYLLTE